MDVLQKTIVAVQEQLTALKKSKFKGWRVIEVEKRRKPSSIFLSFRRIVSR
jgi:hypothetical protein